MNLWRFCLMYNWCCWQLCEGIQSTTGIWIEWESQWHKNNVIDTVESCPKGREILDVTAELFTAVTAYKRCSLLHCLHISQWAACSAKCNSLLQPSYCPQMWKPEGHFQSYSTHSCVESHLKWFNAERASGTIHQSCLLLLSTKWVPSFTV